MMTSVLDDRGEVCLVGFGYHLGGVKYDKDRGGGTTIKAFIVLPDSDCVVTYLPVFTSWFTQG